jgi:hypothetical protein
VAKSAAKAGLPTTPLYAELKPTKLAGRNDSLANFSFRAYFSQISTARKEIEPSGPTLDPENNEKKDENKAPQKVLYPEKSSSFRDSIAPFPSIKLGARKYLIANPTSREKNIAPAGIVQRLAATKSFSQIKLLIWVYIVSQTIVKSPMTIAMNNVCYMAK